MDELAQCYNALPQLDINNTIDHRPEGDEKWLSENEKTVTQFCRKLAAQRPLKESRDEYTYPKKKGSKDERSRLLDTCTKKPRRGAPTPRWARTPSSCAATHLPSMRRRGQAIHGLGQLDVAIGHAAGIVGRQRHLDPVVDVEPFRMMVEFLRDQRRARHEAEGFAEVGEREIPADGVAALHLAPAMELGERARAGASGQFVCHGAHLVVAPIVPRIAVRWRLAKAARTPT